jgi:hypothetical protein
MVRRLRSFTAKGKVQDDNRKSGTRTRHVSVPRRRREGNAHGNRNGRDQEGWRRGLTGETRNHIVTDYA